VARILYVTQWFEPEPNIVKGLPFVHALIAAGHEVEVLTGLPNYPTGKIYPGYRLRPFQQAQVDGITVKRLPLYPSHDTSSAGRALNFMSFFAAVLIYLLLRGRRYDLWYVYHPPITVGLAAALARAVVRRPFILEIQDLWPDTVVVSGMAGTGRMAGLLSALCAFTYARAKRIVVQSQGIADRLLSRGVPQPKLAVVRNWADGSALRLPEADRATLRMTSRFTVVYGGNLGRMQALGTALDAMEMLARRKNDAELILIGDGIERAALEASAKQRGLANVRFVGRVPQSEIGRWFAAADALLLHIAGDPLFEITIPSKTQYYLACGRPLIAGIGGEAAGILAASGAAIVVPPEDAEALANAFERMAAKSAAERDAMGDAGRSFYRAALSFESGIDKTLAVIADAL
jgi:glycosyltransferase involved in cell wall biosynthesis